MEKLSTDYGIYGLVILGLVTAIIALSKYLASRQKAHDLKLAEIEKLHKEERAEWKKDMIKLHEETQEIIKEDIKATKETSVVLASLESMIKTRKL